jgi:tRNA dimethylallyltransferase
MHLKPQAYILIGPTASGKSSVAQLLAGQAGAPLVSADSMNIYRGMDIGTAKPGAAERGAVPTFGIDVADPAEAFSVGDWLNAVKPAFFQCLEKTPIVAGGTGLYVKCLLSGLDKLPAADEKLRIRAEKMTIEELQAEAKKTAPGAYEALADKRNPRRLIRLLEHGGISGGWKKERPGVTGLYVERDVLHKRIAARVEKMYAAGLIEEARGLMGPELSTTARHAIGYAEAFAVLRGNMTEAEAKEKTVIRTRQLAKRQMTWFRHQFRVEWVNTADFPNLGELAAEISRVWKKDGAVKARGV